jgi:hypothetical protein
LAYSPVAVAAFCGLVIWKEFAGASPRAKALVAAALGATAAGIALVSLSPLFAK